MILVVFYSQIFTKIGNAKSQIYIFILLLSFYYNNNVTVALWLPKCPTVNKSKYPTSTQLCLSPESVQYLSAVKESTTE